MQIEKVVAAKKGKEYILLNIRLTWMKSKQNCDICEYKIVINVYCDSLNALNLAKTQMMNIRVTLIDTTCHFIRDANLDIIVEIVKLTIS